MDAYTAGLREAAFEYGIKRLARIKSACPKDVYTRSSDPDSGVSLTLADFFTSNAYCKTHAA